MESRKDKRMDRIEVARSIARFGGTDNLVLPFFIFSPWTCTLLSQGQRRVDNY